MQIQQEIRRGTIIVFLTKYSGIIIGLLVNSFLARLLSPKEFGIVAIVTVFITFFNILSEIGIGVAIVQDQTLTDKDSSDLFKISIFISLILAIAFALFSYPLAWFYDNNAYVLICQLLSVNVFFSALTVVPKSLMLKSKQFKVLGVIEVISALVTGILAIILAIKGASYFSIIWRSIVNSVLIFILYLFFSEIKIKKGLTLLGIRKIARYSFNQFAFNLINYFSRNLDKILIGKYMGSQFLGIYNQSYQLMMYPIANLTNVITPVLHPILAKYQDNKAVIFKEYVKVVEILAILGIPISIFIFFTSEEIILILLGNKWLEVVPILRILSMSVWIQMILSSSGSIFQAAGRTDLLFVNGLIAAVVMVSAITLGVVFFNSLELTSYLLVCAFSINFFQGFYILINKVLKQPSWEFIEVIIKQIPMAGVLIVSFYAMSYYEIRILKPDSVILSFCLKLLLLLVISLTFNLKYLKKGLNTFHKKSSV